MSDFNPNNPYGGFASTPSTSTAAFWRPCARHGAPRCSECGSDNGGAFAFGNPRASATTGHAVPADLAAASAGLGFGGTFAVLAQPPPQQQPEQSDDVDVDSRGHSPQPRVETALMDRVANDVAAIRTDIELLKASHEELQAQLTVLANAQQSVGVALASMQEALGKAIDAMQPQQKRVQQQKTQEVATSSTTTATVEPIKQQMYVVTWDSRDAIKDEQKAALRSAAAGATPKPVLVVCYATQAPASVSRKAFASEFASLFDVFFIGVDELKARNGSSMSQELYNLNECLQRRGIGRLNLK